MNAMNLPALSMARHTRQANEQAVELFNEADALLCEMAMRYEQRTATDEALSGLFAKAAMAMKVTEAAENAASEVLKAVEAHQQLVAQDDILAEVPEGFYIPDRQEER